MKTLYLLLSVLFTINSSHAQGLNGPNAPDVNITYLSSPVAGFSFDISNSSISNNYNESYLEFDVSIDPTAQDRYWRFEGYMVFQLLNDTIDFNETFNTAYSKLAAVADIQNTYNSVNLVLDGCNDTSITLTNSGLTGEIFIENDAFTNLPFVESETYCFRVLAFAKNPYAEDASCSIFDYALIGPITGNGTSITSSCAIANESVGLVEEAYEMVNIFPNPSNDAVCIRKNSGSSTLALTVINELGQIVLEKNFSEDSFKFELPKAGVYTVRFGVEGRYFYRKLIRL